MLSFFPYRHPKRQAAGPLTENLPYVLKGDPNRVDFLRGPYRARCLTGDPNRADAGDPDECGIDLTLERPSPRGTQSRLLLRAFSCAQPVDRVSAEGIELPRTQFEGQRGHLA